jgi:hypothetical protein
MMLAICLKSLGLVLSLADVYLWDPSPFDVYLWDNPVTHNNMMIQDLNNMVDLMKMLML